MDTHAFHATLSEFFSTIINNYDARIDFDVNRDRLLNMLNSTFWDPITLCKPSDDVSIFERVQEALKLVFCHNARQQGLDLAVVNNVLPKWPRIFRGIFNKAVRFVLPVFTPDFDFWDFAGPTMTVDKFLELLNMHIDAYAHIHDIENVDISPRQAKLALKPNGNPNANATSRKKHDPNFYHRCMFCPKLDTSDREDACVDHMQTVHNYYGDTELRRKKERDPVHQKRKCVIVLRLIITKERAIYNSLITRLFEAEKGLAIMKGASHNSLPSLRDVQGEDLEGVKQVELAEKLCAERAQLMGSDLNVSIRQTNVSAWEIGRQNHSQTGNEVNVKIIRDRGTGNAGYCFVKFPSAERLTRPPQ
ncbi:hypothetical protein VMCG_07746 [Cytospora schulzeri]|uniref:RRM domain-containing protein n=1 Tax=Cytospora schulzeri TaxID=448051 RepID=A0A423VZR9_9PEZI|nr:hypothetical protein VMCG_07746 [Valsa malicola]